MPALAIFWPKASRSKRSVITLGHRSASATRTYAKVDLVGLRAVANFDLGGLV